MTLGASGASGTLACILAQALIRSRAIGAAGLPFNASATIFSWRGLVANANQLSKPLIARAAMCRVIGSLERGDASTTDP
jgi:hypothetical protein